MHGTGLRGVGQVEIRVWKVGPIQIELGSQQLAKVQALWWLDLGHRHYLLQERLRSRTLFLCLLFVVVLDHMELSTATGVTS